jgi:hypothetical protein
MEPLRLNRDLVKIVCKHDNLEAYRLYVIARRHFSARSGIFSPGELCDLLYHRYGRSSLHRRPGNKRKPYIKKLLDLFKESILFREAPDGRYIAVSERTILNKYRKNTKSSWYELKSDGILASKKHFTDYCVGVLLAGNKFRANKNIAGFVGCTVRRIQYATRRNHNTLTFRKQYNFVEVLTGPYKEVDRLRAELCNVHGITSPKPYRYKDEWVLRLNAPNSYKSFVLSGVKGYSHAQPPKGTANEECWFMPMRQKEKGTQLNMFGDDYKRWFFNEHVYDITRYLHDHSKFLA